MKMPKGTVSLFAGGQRCECPLYFGCSIQRPCKLREDYVKQWPLEINTTDISPLYSKGLFDKIYKKYRKCGN